MDYVKCQKCGTPMPKEAKYCGMCGSSIKSETLTFWEMLEVGAFIEYTVSLNKFNGPTKLYKYEVMDKNKEIVEFCLTKLSKQEKEIEFLYIGKDRKIWVPPHELMYLDYTGNTIFDKRINPENLVPSKTFTDLWINPGEISVGDLVSLDFSVKIVFSEENYGNRPCYVVTDPNTGITRFWYDKRSGLLLKKEMSISENEAFETYQYLTNIWKAI